MGQREKICHVQKSQDCLENGITTCTGNFFRQNNIFKMDPDPSMILQEPGNRIKSMKINRSVKLCTIGDMPS